MYDSLEGIFMVQNLGKYKDQFYIYHYNIMHNTQSTDEIDSDNINIKIEMNNADIADVRDEETLLNYTNNHFITQIYHLGNDSPITMSDSNYNSDEFEDLDDDNDSETELNDIKNRTYCRYKKLSYSDVEKSINHYIDDDHKKSNILDIMVTYLNGQKTLYNHSQYIMQTRHNMLSIPCIIITAVITIITPFIQNYDWSGGLVSALNACILLLISLILYFKLDSSADLFLHLANQYNKLETNLEISNNKLMFIDDENEYNKMILSQIRHYENKITELKESNTIVIPSIVSKVYPIISFINVFSFIKRVETYKKTMIIKLKDIKNEIRYILHKWKGGSDSTNKLKEEERLLFLYELKDKIKKEVIYYKNAYSHIDELFAKEIKKGEMIKNEWYYTQMSEIIYSNNPIIDDYLKFIFIE